MDAQKEIIKLRRELEYHNKLYYVDDAPDKRPVKIKKSSTIAFPTNNPLHCAIIFIWLTSFLNLRVFGHPFIRRMC